MNVDLQNLARLKVSRELQRLNDAKHEELQRSVGSGRLGAALDARTQIELKYLELACRAACDIWTEAFENSNNERLTQADLNRIYLRVLEIARSRHSALVNSPRTADTPPNFTAVARNVAQEIDAIVGKIRQDLLIRYQEQRLRPSRERSMPSDMHITINAGNVNFGTQVGTIEAALTKIVNQGQTDVAIALHDLADGVARTKELQEEQKKEIMEILAELASQAERQAQSRSKGVIRSLMGRLPLAIGLVADLTTLWQAYGPVLVKFFDLK